MNQKKLITILATTTIMAILSVSLFTQLSASTATTYDTDNITVNGVLASDSYALYPYDKANLILGISKYGELINGAGKVGLKYKDMDVFANPNVLEKDWSQGWFIDIHYTDLENHYKRAWAFAMYSDLSGSTGIGGDWKENCTGDPTVAPPYGGRKTNVWATTDPIKVLYDGPRQFVALTKTTLYDSSDRTADSALVSITITFVFNKDEKVVMLFKDIKRLDKGKFGRTFQIEFSNRGEWDIGTAAAPKSYAHFYHNLETAYGYEYHNFYGAAYPITGYDVAQMIDEGGSYVGFAAFWPQLYGKLVDGTTHITRTTILNSLSTKVYNNTWLALGAPTNKSITFGSLGWPSADPYPVGLGLTSDEPMVFKNGILLTGGNVDYTWDDATDTITFNIAPANTDYITIVYKHQTNPGADDMVTHVGTGNEPDTPYVIGEWCFDLKNEDNKRQFRAVTVYGLTDRHDGDDDDAAAETWSAGSNVIDSEAQYYLDEIFNPYDLYSAVEKDTRRWVQFYTVSATDVTAQRVSLNLTHTPVIKPDDWTEYSNWAEKVEWSGALKTPYRASSLFGGYNYTFYGNEWSGDGTGNITITGDNVPAAGTMIKVLYSTNATWQKEKTDFGTFGNTSTTIASGSTGLLIPNAVINSTTWSDPLGTAYNITVLSDNMYAKQLDTLNNTATGTDDLQLTLDIKIRPESGYVEVHNSTYYYADTTLYATNTTFNGNMSVMFKVTPPSHEHVHITGDILLRANHTYVNATHVAMANYTLVYANLTTSIGGTYEWMVVGKDASAIDSLGAAYMTEAFDSLKEIHTKIGGLDINDTALGPYAPFVMAGAATGTKADYRDTLGRVHLRDDWCTTYPVTSSNMLFSGGPRAQMGTEYFNEFTNAFFARSEYVTNDTGQADKILALSCWNRTTYGAGYAVISVYEDLNGTIGFLIWGYDGQDTEYAAKWFWDYPAGILAPDGTTVYSGIEYLQHENRGVTDIVLKITYPTANPTHPTVSIKERLGTISEKTPHEDP